MNQKNEMLVDIIEQLKNETYEQKQIYLSEKDMEKKNVAYYWLLGLAQALSSIKRTLMTWHPCETDEEYQEIYKAYGVDFEIDQEFLV